jgi:mono/diheme cytochrome c family protein
MYRGGRALFALLPLTLGLALGVSGCEMPGVGKQGGAKSAVYMSFEAAGAGFETFKTTLFPAVRQNCASCHGVNQNPQFALADAASDYATLRNGLVDFDVPENSFIVRQLVGGHQGFAAQAGPFTELITKWAAAESSRPGGGDGGLPGGPIAANDPRTIKIASAALTLPATLPSTPGNVTSNNYARVRWDLSSATPADPDLVGAYFEVDVQFQANPTAGLPGAYLFRRPRVGSVSNSLSVKNVKLLLLDRKANRFVYNPQVVDWVGIETLVAPNAGVTAGNPLPFPILSNDPLLIAQSDNYIGSDTPYLGNPIAGGQDQFQVAFEVLQRTTTPNCKNPTGNPSSFDVTAYPVMQNQCVRCHGGGNATATARFSMQGTAAQVCDRALQRVNLNFPTQSALIGAPTLGTGSMGRINGFNSQPFLDWIQSEAQLQ